MIKSGKLLKEQFPNMLHVTCLAHGLHRICEFVRDNFSDVNKLISLVKKIFLKAPSRVSIYKGKYPHLPLLPAPVITRWGTWIEANSFYFNNLEQVKTVISSLSDNARSIIDCKMLLAEPSLSNNIRSIQEHSGTLPSTITFFEIENIPLKEGLSKLNNVLNNLKVTPGEIGPRLWNKIDTIKKKIQI